MKIKSTTAFRAYTTMRANEAITTKRFIVKSVNKDGSISRMAPTKTDWQLNAFEEADAAEARRVELERLNPGSRFAFVPL
ncbi:hypothetical protein [Myxococcus virescens]|uniref:Uncharacterized protein n=1 Tax=Myxococcus virescens TaxID=83456 RepID=A0A511HPW0_9BACT|nr:hypothetical protein [Myxococcus virescens]GEL75623.1 hypothetical protein MVI01_74070 [Myxococcus virescens]SDF28047.1 hypothetical protein SAMN04488504_12770 [Myxococcus virescens]